MDNGMLWYALVFLIFGILCFAKKVNIVKTAAEKDGKDVDKTFNLMGTILMGFALLSIIGYLGIENDNLLITGLVLVGGVIIVIGGIRYNIRSGFDSKSKKDDETENKD